MGDWYQIENGYCTIQLNSKGAELKRMFVKPWRKELLWSPQEEISKKVWNRSAPILFPIVGKLKGNEFTFKGKTFQMSQHGFARDMDFECLESGQKEIEFQLIADQETFSQYPFCFELKVRYTLLENKLIVLHTVKNVDRQDMYFSIGAHPAFLTNKIENFEIKFEKEERGYFRLKDGLVDWSQIFKIDSDQIKLSKELFLNDALIFKDLKSKYIDLIDNKTHEIIRMHGIQTPYFGIWGKDSVPFICMEPWFGVGDEASHDQNLESKKGIQLLPMGEEFKFSFEIELINQGME